MPGHPVLSGARWCSEWEWADWNIQNNNTTRIDDRQREDDRRERRRRWEEKKRVNEEIQDRRGLAIAKEKEKNWEYKSRATCKWMEDFSDFHTYLRSHLFKLISFLSLADGERWSWARARFFANEISRETIEPKGDAEVKTAEKKAEQKNFPYWNTHAVRGELDYNSEFM